MEATIAAPAPPAQSPLSCQTAPNTNTPQPLPRNVTPQENRTPDPAPRAIPFFSEPKINTNSLTYPPSCSQNTLPAVQDFLQKAYETVQRAQQGAPTPDSVQGAAAANIPSPRVATAMIQHPLQNTFSIPLPPLTPAATPFLQTTVTAQPPASPNTIKTVEDSSITKPSLTPDKIKPTPKGQSNMPTRYFTSTSSRTENTSRSAPTSPKPGQAKAFQAKQKARTAPESPQKRQLLVAKRRQNPNAAKTVESEQTHSTQSCQSSSVLEKSSSQPQSPKSQKPSGSKSQRTQPLYIPKYQNAGASDDSSPQSPQTSSSSDSARSGQSSSDSPPFPGTSRVAQTYQHYVAQKERDQAAPTAQFQQALVKRNVQSNASVPCPTQANGDRRDVLKLEPDLDPTKTVLVSGFAPYTQPQDLTRVLAAYGACRVERCRNRLAVVVFESEAGARRAVRAADHVCIYGEFVEITEYTNARHVSDMFKAFKKVISTQKGDDIIQPSSIDLSGDFYQQLENIKSAILLTREQVSDVSRLYRDLERVLQAEWPGCVAVPFGSIPAGLGIKSSDADCYVRLPARYHARHAAAAFVTRARRLLLAYPRAFAGLVAIPRANTPILKFRHVPTGFHCDVSCKTPLGAQNSKLIKLLLEHDARLPPVAVLLKYWAKVHGLSGTGRLTNYALTMMVVFYFQQPRVALVPAVERLQRDPAAAFIVDHWNAGFAGRREPPPQPCTLPVPDLLGGFFEFYSRFDFDALVICPYLGVPLLKQQFLTPERLPRELARYVANVRENLASPMRHNTPFCVQDPFEQSHNVASAVTQKLASEIRAFLKHAADAYAADKATGCRAFLRTILTSRPKLARERGAPSTKLFLFPRVRGELADGDWRARVRTIVLDLIFDQILRIPLQRDLEREAHEREEEERQERQRAETQLEENGNEERPKRQKMETEKYMGSASKPVWRRRKNYSAASPEPEQSLVARQQALTDQIIATANETALEFDLEMGFRDEPRNCYIFAKMVDGDLDAFRGLVGFIHTGLFDWFRILIRPHLRPVDNRPRPAPRHAERGPRRPGRGPSGPERAPCDPERAPCDPERSPSESELVPSGPEHAPSSPERAPSDPELITEALQAATLEHAPRTDSESTDSSVVDPTDEP